MSLRRIAAIALVAACSHSSRPTVTGAELYAQLQPLRDSGQATVGAVAIRTGQVLTAGDQTFVVEQVIQNCHGGDPTTDVDCTLALLLDKRFTVLDQMPPQKTVGASHEDRSRSIVTSVVVIGLGVAAVGGLVYGIATCEFPGCKYVFGVPLVFIGGAALFALGRD